MNGQSMEEFVPVSMDYFTQQRVTKVVENNGEAVWSIYFEGGGVLHNFDPTLPSPKTIVGAALTMTILGGHGPGRVPLTELRFGLETVLLNPLEYAIADPNYTKGVLVYAQRSHANMPTIPPHPDDRVAEGPDESEDENAKDG